MSRYSVHTSANTYTGTITQLKAAIAKSGATLFATIDQAAAAQTAGTTLRPTTVLLFGNPKSGSPLMTATPAFALALPLKLVVYQEDGAVKVAHDHMADVATDYGVAAGDPTIAAMDQTLASLTSAIGGP